MPGKIVRVIGKTPFDFSNVVAGQFFEAYYQTIDTSEYIEATLLVRVHSFVVTDPAEIYVNTYPRAPTDEDPAFYTEDNLTQASGITMHVSDTTPPALRRVKIAAPKLSGALVIVVGGTQSNPATTLTATLSIDLVLKS